MMKMWCGLTAALALAAAGCVEEGNPAIMTVEGNIVPQSLLVNNLPTCLYSAAQQVYFTGTLDFAQAAKLRYYAQVKNNMVATTVINGSSEAQLRQDGNTITVTGVHVKMTRPGTVKTTSPLDGGKAGVFGAKATAPIVAEWDVKSSGVVYVNKGGQVAFDLVPDQLQPGVDWGKEIQRRLAANKDRYTYNEEVTLSFTIQGVTGSGKPVAAGEIAYPVTFCWGCLLTPMGAPDPKQSELDKAVWGKCTTTDLPAGYVPPCQLGGYENTLCAYYCQKCKIAETTGGTNGVKCDLKFCPTPEG